MRGSVIRFILGSFALYLIIDVTIHLVYRVYRHSVKNRLIEEYADNPSNDSPPLSIRIGGLAISIILNLLIYFFV